MKIFGDRLMLQALAPAMAVMFTGLLAVAGEHLKQDSTITIVVVTGQNARNILQGDIATQPIVEIRDTNGAPVAKARVTFTLPDSGPRVAFSRGKDAKPVTTAKDGRAASGDLKPIGTGAFDIAVRARYHGRDAVATIRQTNFATLADSEANERVGGTPITLAAGDNLFKIEVLQGDDGVNIIDKDSAVKSLVRVVDKNNLPVAGIAITVALVAVSAAEGGFEGDRKTTTVITGPDGVAEVALDRVTGEGPLQLQMHATVHGQSLQAAVTQTNYKNEGAALGAGKIPGASKGSLTGGQTIPVTTASGSGQSTSKVANKIVASPTLIVQATVESTSQPSCLFGSCGLGPMQAVQGGFAFSNLATGNSPLAAPMGFSSGSGLAPQALAAESAQAAPSSPTSTQASVQTPESKQTQRSIASVLGSFLGTSRLSLNLPFGSPWGCGSSPLGFLAPPGGPFLSQPSFGLMGPPIGYCGGPFAAVRAPTAYFIESSPLLPPSSAALPSPNGAASAPPAIKPAVSEQPALAKLSTPPAARTTEVAAPGQQTDDSAALTQRLQEARERIRQLHSEHNDLGRESAGLERSIKMSEVQNLELRQRVLRVPGPRPAAAAGTGRVTQPRQAGKTGSSKHAAPATRVTPPPRVR